jgi:hypothetical protein
VNETKTCFFAYRNRKWHFFTRKIVDKVALFYTKNRSESSIFLHRFIPSPWKRLSKHTYFFLLYKKRVCTTRYESLFFSLICLINSDYALVNQFANL